MSSTSTESPAVLVSAPHRGLLTANLICMASMALWASGLPAAELIIPLLPGEQLAALRMGLAALFLLPLWALIEGGGALLRANWLRGILVGSMIGLGAWLIILGQARSGPVTAAVISAMMPVIGIGLEVVLDGRKITAPLALGLGLALIGGVVSLDLTEGGLSLGLGAVCCLGSIFFFVLGSRLTVTGFPGLTPIGRTGVTVTGATIALGLLALVPVSLGLAPLPDLSGWGLRQFAALAVFAIGGFALSQVLWIIAVGRLGIGMSSLHINAAPFYVMLMLIAMGQGWSGRQIVGAALVGLGVIVAQGLIRLPAARTP